MNKLLIPSILAVTIIVAGIFAFMPIDEATTVHTTLQSSTAATTQTTTLQGNIDKQDRIISYTFMTGSKNLNATSGANILPFKDEAWTGNATVIVSDGFGKCFVNEVDDGAGGGDGTRTLGASQTGTGANTSDFSAIDRLEVIVESAMECTVVVFLNQTKE